MRSPHRDVASARPRARDTCRGEADLALTEIALERRRDERGEDGDRDEVEERIQKSGSSAGAPPRRTASRT